MVTNEEDNGLKEVLPMVMLAFKGSAMAEERGGWMQAKLLFVYRSVDTNDVQKLQKNQRKLQEDLRGAAFEVANTRIYGIDEESSSEPSIRDVHPVVVSQSTMIDSLKKFQINVQEEKSDVKYFGNLKKVLYHHWTFLIGIMAQRLLRCEITSTTVYARTGVGRVMGLWSGDSIWN
jgi:hypothetical protein